MVYRLNITFSLLGHRVTAPPTLTTGTGSGGGTVRVTARPRGPPRRRHPTARPPRLEVLGTSALPSGGTGTKSGGGTSEKEGNAKEMLEEDDGVDVEEEVLAPEVGEGFGEGKRRLLWLRAAAGCTGGRSGDGEGGGGGNGFGWPCDALVFLRRRKTESLEQEPC
ncbi:hypothetical protein ABZP36_013515 [Zizania latifolia]